MKKTLTLVLALVMLMTAFFTGCEKKETTSDGERMTITVGYTGVDDTWTNDDYYRYITDKIGVDIEFQALSSDGAPEKARLWISSGNMPDVVLTPSFLFDEYIKYAEQGMIGEFPKNWEKDYPNVAFAMEMTGILDVIKESSPGEVAVMLRAQDNYEKYIDELRVAYEDGANMGELLFSDKYTPLTSTGFAYRKDWAEKLGIKTDYIMEYDDFLDMVRKFKEADLGNVGAMNTVGMSVDYTEAPNFFITAFNSNYKQLYKNETGKYICGLTEDTTLEGLKEYTDAYRTGILSPDFYTMKSKDLNALFCSQRSGVVYPRGSSYYLKTLNSDFEAANPGLKAEDCISVCWVRSRDGKIHSQESSNYYGCYYLSPNLSDEKKAKIFELADYICSKEGGPQVRLGVPGVDYKVEDGEYIVLRERDADGVIPDLSEKYPSYSFFRQFLNPFFDMSEPTDPYAMELEENLRAAKLGGELSLLKADPRRDLYTADDYVKFKAAYEVNGLFAEIVVEEGDVEERWEKKRKEIEKAAKPVLENMNKSLIK